MPILNVEIVGDERDFPRGLAQRIADAAGLSLASRPRGTWVKLSFLSAQNYAENGGIQENASPIIVSVIQQDLPPLEDLREQIARLTDAIASATGVSSENVHIVIEPGAKGRIAFGGYLVE